MRQCKNKPKLKLPSITEKIRKKGQRKDKVLAHINPLQAMLLKNTSGGDINPTTGLPQFGLLSNPKKWFKSVAGPAAGVILGNMILPGIGGVIGGAFGGAAGSVVRGRNDMGQAMLRGGAMGAMLPTAASLAGSGANALGAKGLGTPLTNYGTRNAILPNIGLGEAASKTAIGHGNTPGNLAEMMKPHNVATTGNSGSTAAHQSFIDSLTKNTSNYLSKPKNLLTLATAAGSFLDRPKPKKEKTPEQIADEQKRLNKAMRLSPAEMTEQEKYLLAEEHMRRRLKKNRFLPEERIEDMDPIYARVNTPEEYAQAGRWINYYNNPNFVGDPVRFKKGGKVKSSMLIEMMKPIGLQSSSITEVPCSRDQPIVQKAAQDGMYFNGYTKGQDDEIPAVLSDGEYVIPADVVSHLGDGNNKAGAVKLDDMIKKVRHSKKVPNKLPPKAKSLASYIGV